MAENNQPYSALAGICLIIAVLYIIGWIYYETDDPHKKIENLQNNEKHLLTRLDEANKKLENKNGENLELRIKIQQLQTNENQSWTTMNKVKMELKKKEDENAELQKKIKQLENNEKQSRTTMDELKMKLKKKEDENSEQKKKNAKLQTTMNDVKRELENQTHQLVGKLKDAETEREKNKEELQSVETKITERGNVHGKESLFGMKEELLQSWWKMEENKTIYEKQLLNVEKVLEPIDLLLSTLTNKVEGV